MEIIGIALVSDTTVNDVPTAMIIVAFVKAYVRRCCPHMVHKTYRNTKYFGMSTTVVRSKLYFVVQQIAQFYSLRKDA